jgi:APA family basic amino acid/polyamine antiporter
VGKPGYATLIAAGAVAGLTTVVMTLLIGTSRVVFAMSPRLAAAEVARQDQPQDRHAGQDHRHHRHARRLIAALTPIGKLEYMINIGTLTAFFLVSLAVPVLRKRRPDLKRRSRCPATHSSPGLRRDRSTSCSRCPWRPGCASSSG